MTAQGRLRKDPKNLTRCKLMEVVQYSCHLEGTRRDTAVVKCEPIVRLFRRFVWAGLLASSKSPYKWLMGGRCENGCIIETTALEG